MFAHLQQTPPLPPPPNVTCSGGGWVQVGVVHVGGGFSGERGAKGANVRVIEEEQRGKSWGGGGRAQRNLFAI